MEHEIFVTSDGSHSILIKEWNEHYHSFHGAVQESKHVFINAGFNAHSPHKNKCIQILEIGLGTGLNALLTLIESQKTESEVFYTALEPHPLNPDIIKQLNYATVLGDENYRTYLQQIHSCNFNELTALSLDFTFEKRKETVQAISFKKQYNLVYFDAFAPRVQPELWTEEVFKKLYETMLPEGILVTYCAKGEVKRTLKKVGFTVETLQGPPGKREMIRALKDSPCENN